MAYGFEILINKFVLGSIGDSVSPSTLTVERIQKSFIQDICSQSQMSQPDFADFPQRQNWLKLTQINLLSWSL